ncbi:MAG: glucokinase [Chloroflexota bacterium]|jgi:glucokinase|nr:glucokinase [Chloroflexota bacterium]
MSLVFGIDIGGTNLRVALAGEDGAILRRAATPTDEDAAPEAVVETLGGMMRGLAHEQGVELAEVGATGVGLPGVTDPRRGVLHRAPHLPKWREVPFGDMLRGATAIATHVQNDANLAAYGEFHQGAGRGTSDLLFVTVSTGIGGGIVINRRLYSGASGAAGEVGHIVVDPDGPECSCGARGCLESLASGSSMARLARERMAAGEESSLARLDGPVTGAAVAAAAVDGDALALDILHRAGHLLGLGLGSLLNILDPEVLVLGGGSIQSGAPLLEPMYAALRRQAFEAILGHVRIELAGLGQDAGLVGAVEWARDHLPGGRPDE